MKKLYEKDGVLFAVLWIVAYCLLLIPLRGAYGDGSPWTLLALAAIAVGITVFVKRNHLEKESGLTGWPQNSKRYLYFIPMWILSTGNLWGGFFVHYHGIYLVCAVLSMLLVGYVEEMLFRGFLFKALLKKDGVKPAVIISAVTFGIGHIVNLLSGQASPETFIQIIFAIAWGFLLTLAFYKSGSLIPCIIIHGLLDVFSTFAAESAVLGLVYMGVTIVFSIAYCTYLVRLPAEKS